MKMARAHLVIAGVVQGVFFRATTTDEATRLGVTGWVRNRPDGTVEAVVEGEEEAVRKLVLWCHKGPSRARVDNVQVEWEEYLNEFDGFAALTRHSTY